jgi:hypothetical protein
MTNVKVFRSEMGIPLVVLSGDVIEKDGTELAGKIMRQIYTATSEGGKDDYPAKMSEREPITSKAAAAAPEGGS